MSFEIISIDMSFEAACFACLLAIAFCFTLEKKNVSYTFQFRNVNRKLLTEFPNIISSRKHYIYYKFHNRRNLKLIVKEMCYEI